MGSGLGDCMRILLVDDEERLLRTIQLGWPDENDEIVTARSFEEVKPHIYAGRDRPLDCIVLDLQLPDASGSTILAEIKKNQDTPVIMLSAWGDTQFRADTLHKGADDYVMKPVGVGELHARVQRLHRQKSSGPRSGDQVFNFGPCELKPIAQELSGPVSSVKLTGAEAALLEVLAAAYGQPVSRRDLYLKAFSRESRYGDKTLETYIGRLRRMLTEIGDDGPNRLLSVRGVGYRLVPGA